MKRIGSYEAKGKYEAREVDKGKIWKDIECYVNVFFPTSAPTECDIGLLRILSREIV